MALIRELKLFLLESTKEYNAAQNSKGEIAKPKVFEWSLPFKLAKNRANPNPRGRGQEISEDEEELAKLDDEVFPYIVIRPFKGIDTEDDSTIQVELIFGVKDEGPEINGLVYPTGYNALFTFMEYVKVKLQQQVTIGQKFNLEKPSEWEIESAQPYPYFGGSVKTKWTVASVIDERSASFLHG